MHDPQKQPPRSWYRGMNPTLAFIGLGGIFVLLAFLMLARGSGDDKSTMKEVLTRPGPASQQK